MGVIGCCFTFLCGLVKLLLLVLLLFGNFHGNLDLYLYQYQYTYQSVIQLAFLTYLFSKIHNPYLNAIFGSETRTYFHPIG